MKKYLFWYVVLGVVCAGVNRVSEDVSMYLMIAIIGVGTIIAFYADFQDNSEYEHFWEIISRTLLISLPAIFLLFSVSVIIGHVILELFLGK